VLVFRHDYPPFVSTPGEGQPMERHHRADQIIDGRENFDRPPAILAQPKLMQDLPKADDQRFYIRVPLEKRGKTRRVILDLQSQSVKMAQEVSCANEYVSKDLLYFAEDQRGVSIESEPGNAISASGRASL